MLDALIDWLARRPTQQAAPIAMAGAALLSVIGLQLIHQVIPHRLRSMHNDVAGFTLSLAGLVYAVLLAFIAVAVWQGYEQAAMIVQTEANLVGDLYRDTAGLPDPQAAAVRHTLFVYSETVIQDEWPALAAGEEEAAAGWQLLDSVHLALVQLQPQNPTTVATQAEMLRTLDALYDARRARFHSAVVTLPPVLWWNLLAGALVLLVFASLFGVPNLAMHSAMLGMVGASIGLVLILIVLLSHPFQGDNHISAAAFNTLMEEVERMSYPHP